MERAVGWFVMLAAALLAFGFAYYVYQTAESKGWFIPKITYQTSLANGTGLKAGDPVKLMGFDVGEITKIQANGPYDYYNITVDFRIKAPYYGYLWSDSTVKVAAGDFLGNRNIEVTKGRLGVPTIDETDKTSIGMLKRDYLRQRAGLLTKEGGGGPGVWQQLNTEALQNKSLYYTRLTKNSVYWLDPEESPALADRLEMVVNQVQTALPNFLRLTNQLALLLSNSINLTSNLDIVAADARPAVSNLALVTAQLNRPGALGEWVLPTNLNGKLDTTLTIANTNLVVLAGDLGRTLDNLAAITGGLSRQVQENTNMLGAISRAIMDADDLVQGFKRHWLLRSAFKNKSTNAPPQTPPVPLRSPKEKDERD
jgi:ABC-type transporter Mla subunit MlaD